jgi:hypothetical protein
MHAAYLMLLQIQWDATERTKWVKRLNLFFADESRVGFRFRLRQVRAQAPAREGPLRPRLGHRSPKHPAPPAKLLALHTQLDEAP